MIGKLGLIALFLAFVAYGFKSVTKTQSPIIKTSLGSLQGIESISRDGRLYYEYLGIPYAKPPIGDLRFEVPESPETWTGIRAANEYGSECSQVPILFGIEIGSEDCLYLNVFSPKTQSDSLLPTMVFIHGGHFLEGSGNFYRPDYFMDENIVLVTFNYRLAALGFLNTGDGVVRGNAGLKDQAMALKWVKRNIANFGGDPTRVTIFGESAGGVSVHLHMLSPFSQGLFQKAISQSGNAIVVGHLIFRHGQWDETQPAKPKEWQNL